jgi:hypothetical protein
MAERTVAAAGVLWRNTNELTQAEGLLSTHLSVYAPPASTFLQLAQFHMPTALRFTLSAV